MSIKNYSHYQNILQNHSLPLAFVDLDILDQNIRSIRDRANGKKIRIASKSIRCPYIMDYILKSHDSFQGIMCYTGNEAVYLSRKGFDDLLVAYPIWDEPSISEVCQELKKGKKISLMVDCAEHITRLDSIAQKHNTKIPVCIDIDMSSNYLGLHFGVQRSGVQKPDQVLELCRKIDKLDFVDFAGVMGYEAQIAGLPDDSPANIFALNMVIRQLKKLSRGQVKKRRQAIVANLQKNDFSPCIVNGGGTGSVEFTCEEDCITEVTAGSGFYASHLFDYYRNFRNTPATLYAIEITRNPRKNIYTCHGGGYTASGSLGKDKIPIAYLPEGATLLDTEGAGEVQTPIFYKGSPPIKIGDPIFMRHSKAGELCEHFNTLLLIRGDNIIDEVPTYRGEGQCFL